MQYKRGRGWATERDFLSWRGGWTVGGGAVLVFCSYGAEASVGVLQLWCGSKCWCGDTFHPPEKSTLYLKVTPFDSNTPTHLHTKIPIGGYVLHSFTAKLPPLPDNKTH
nr:MAG TPA: hypothetical protein [Caudoviricetes sp.]